MKKKFLWIFSLFLIFNVIFLTANSEAKSELGKIKENLRDVKQNMNEVSDMKKSATKKLDGLKNEKDITTANINDITNQLAVKEDLLQKTFWQISRTEDQLLATGEKLDRSIKERDKRNEFMGKRLRSSYVTGPTSMIDVLLDAQNFSDLIRRIDIIGEIASQDQKVLEEKKQTVQKVNELKKQSEAELAKVKNLYTKAEQQKEALINLRNNKQQSLLQVKHQIKDIEDISDEAQQQLLILAQEASALVSNKQDIEASIARAKAEAKVKGASMAREQLQVTQKKESTPKESSSRKKNEKESSKDSSNGSGGDNSNVSGGRLAVPLHSSWSISSPFGWRIHPITGIRKFHSGLDMAAPNGTPVFSADTGVVIVAQSMGGYGNCIMIDHGGGVTTVYGHLSQIGVHSGKVVHRGERIGAVGSTGASTGNHLHFEVRINSQPVDPLPYIR